MSQRLISLLQYRAGQLVPDGSVASPPASRRSGHQPHLSPGPRASATPQWPVLHPHAHSIASPPPHILLAPGTSRQARRRHLSCPGSSARADTPNPAGRIQRPPNSLRGWVLRGQEGRAQVSSQLESELRAITASLLSRKPPHRLTEHPPGSSHPGHWRGTDKPDRQALCPPRVHSLKFKKSFFIIIFMFPIFLTIYK